MIHFKLAMELDFIQCFNLLTSYYSFAVFDYVSAFEVKLTISDIGHYSICFNANNTDISD